MHVRETLEHFSSKDFLLGLITGNLEGIARAKLGKVNLFNYFRLGGFGNESDKREELVKSAINKAVSKFNFNLGNPVFIIGDTPNDIIAGKKSGAKTIGITTGVYDKESLLEAKPDFVIEERVERNIVYGPGEEHKTHFPYELID